MSGPLPRARCARFADVLLRGAGWRCAYRVLAELPANREKSMRVVRMKFVSLRPSDARVKPASALLALCMAAANWAIAATPAQALSNCTKEHKVLRVGTYKGNKGQCKSIQEAVANIAPGNWILIGPGDYKQSASQKVEGAEGDDRAGADIVVTTPNI